MRSLRFSVALLLAVAASCGETSEDDSHSDGGAGTDAGVGGASGASGGSAGASGGSAGTAGTGGAAGLAGSAGSDAGLPICGKDGVCISSGTTDCPVGYTMTQMGCDLANGQLGSCCIPTKN